MPACQSTKCPNQAVGGTTFCSNHRDGVRLCEYKACRNGAAAGQLYCRAHTGGTANRVMDSLVPDKQVALNADPDVLAWLKSAKAKVETFNSNVSDDFIKVFFGNANVVAARKVFNKMPDALARFATGAFKIIKRPVYTVTSTPNAVESGTGTLSVSPGFMDRTRAAENVYVLIHESSHAAGVVDGTIPFVFDRAYYGNALFHNLRPAERLRNADHFRMCVQRFDEGKSVADCRDFAVINQDLPTGGGGAVVRKVTTDWSYARYIITGAIEFHTHVWLHLFDTIIAGTEAYHDHPGAKGGKMGTREARLKPVLGKGKSSSDFKAKDYVRLEDLYRKTRDWIDYLGDDSIVGYEDIYDAGLRNLERVTLEKDGASRKFKVTSNFQPNIDMLVDDKALAAGVRQVVQKVLQERPYPKVERSDLVTWAKTRAGNAGPKWYRHL